MKPKLNLDISTIIRAQVININNSASSSVIELTDPQLVCPHDSNLPVINSFQRAGTNDVSDCQLHNYTAPNIGNVVSLSLHLHPSVKSETISYTVR